MKNVLCCLIICLVPSVCFAGAKEPYQQRSEIMRLLFFDMNIKYGLRFRASSVYDACGYKELSKKVSPSTDEMVDFLHEKVKVIMAEREDRSRYLLSISAESCVELIEEVMHYSAYYRLGYTEAYKAVIDRDKQACSKALNLIDEVLKSK